MLPSVKKKIISVDEKWLRKYMTDALGSVHDSYVGPFLNYGHVSLLEVGT